MEKQTFTRDEVVELINTILEHADCVMDAITNEYTDWDGQSLLQLAEEKS